MIVDLVSLFVFGVLLFLGWRSGALRQILRLVAIVAVFFGVSLVSPLVRSIVFGESGPASPGVEVASFFLAAVLIYGTITLAGWLAIKVLRLVSRTLGMMDRAGGATLGALKAVIMIYLAVVLVVFMEGPLLEHDPENKLRLRDGHLTEFVAQKNVLAPWQFPDLERLHDALLVAAAIDANGAYEIGRGDDRRAAVLREERFRALLQDEELMAWVERDHYPMTLADERVRALLNDAEFVRKLQRVDWKELDNELTALSDA